jgi:hypothetical protein
MHYRRLWLSFAIVIIASFAVLGYYGKEIYRQTPPVPERVVVADDQVILTGQHRGRGLLRHTTSRMAPVYRNANLAHARESWFAARRCVLMPEFGACGTKCSETAEIWGFVLAKRACRVVSPCVASGLHLVAFRVESKSDAVG